MTAKDTQLDYQRIPASFPPAQAGVGIASLIVAVSFLLLGLVIQFDVLESLSLQFYFYSIGFMTAFALGVWGLLMRSRRRSAAWIGVTVSVLGCGWKVSSLYVAMQSCVANGWMRMPWPLR